MHTKSTVRTFDTIAFRERFLEKNRNTDRLFKPHFESFFCLKIEDLLPYARLPIPPSRENAHAIIFLVSGSYTHHIGYTAHTLAAPAILCVPAGQIFSITHIPAGVRGFSCHFHPDILVGKYGSLELLNSFGFLQVWGNPHIALGHGEAGFVANLFHRLHALYGQDGIQNLATIQAYLFALLTEIDNYSPERVPEKHASAANITNRFKALVLQQKKTHLKVSELAGLLNITTNHLNKSVKGVTGKSPTTWVNEAIIMEAKYLLYQTTMSVSEVAAEVGHHDQSYFSRLFKKIEGVTPSAFRKLIEKS